MEPEITQEVTDALLELNLSAADVASWREEGYTLIIITTAGEKHRIVWEHLFPKKTEEE